MALRLSLAVENEEKEGNTGIEEEKQEKEEKKEKNNQETNTKNITKNLPFKWSEMIQKQFLWIFMKIWRFYPQTWGGLSTPLPLQNKLSISEVML